MKLPTAAGPRSASSLTTIAPFEVVIVAVAVDPAAAWGGAAVGQVEATADGAPADAADEPGEVHPPATRPTASAVVQSEPTIRPVPLTRRPPGRPGSRSCRRATPRRG